MVSAIISAVSEFVKTRAFKIMALFAGGVVTGAGAVLLAPKMRRLIKYKKTGQWDKTAE